MNNMICENAKACGIDCPNKKAHKQMAHCSIGCKIIKYRGSKCIPVKEKIEMNKKIKSVKTKVPMVDIPIGCSFCKNDNNLWEFWVDDDESYEYSEEDILRNPDVFEVEFEEEKKKRSFTWEEFLEISNCWFRCAEYSNPRKIIAIDNECKRVTLGAGIFIKFERLTEYSHDLKTWHKMEKELTK